MGRNCPSEQELIAFTQGTLPAAEVDALADHLEACLRCEAAAEQLEGAFDPFVGALRLVQPSTSPWFHQPNNSSLSNPAKWPSPPGYDIVAPLGHGGMGIVYRARQVGLQRLVALKRLPTGSDRELERARIEAEALARLQHPNIVQIYEVVAHEGRAYLALELVEGGSLAAHMTGKPQSPRESAHLIETIARAVHYAHSNGIVHRDLKPANILLHIANLGTREEDGGKPTQSAIRHLHTAIPKLTDFGLAKRLAVASSDTRDGDVIGTPSYMSPEQAAGKTNLVGTATDIYSLGVVLYELLTGRVPLEGQSTIDTLILVRSEDPVSPRLLQPRIPRDLETICLKCLEKSPVRRYASALALAEDLRRFQAGEPILARPVSTWERSWKWAKRQPVVATLTAAIVLGAILSFGLIAWQWQRAEIKAKAEKDAKLVVEDRERKEREARRQVERLTASFAVHQGVALCERGEPGRGLLWQVRALELAAKVEDADLERVARINLADWQKFLVKQRAECPNEGGLVWTVALSGDGRTAWTASDDGTVRRWDAATGKQVGEPFKHSLPVWSLTFSADGTTCLTGSGDDNRQGGAVGAAQLWNARTGAALHPSMAHPSEVYQVAFNRDATTFLTVCRERVQLWRTADQKPVCPPWSHPKPAKPDRRVFPLLCAAFSPDGTLVATGGADGTARLWNAATGQPHGPPMSTPGAVQVVAFSPDGRDLLTGSFHGGVQRWDVASQQPHGPALPHRGRVKFIVFSPDGELLATGGVNEIPMPGEKRPRLLGEVRLWHAATGRLLPTPLDHPAPVWSVAFSPEGRLLVTGCEDGRARFFLVATGALLDRPRSHDGTVPTVALSRDGRIAISASGGGDKFATARIWNLAPEHDFPRLLRQGSTVMSLAFSPDGRFLLAGSTDGKAKFWDVATGRLALPVLNHAAAVSSVAISPDGRTLLTSDHQGILHAWNRETSLESHRARQDGYITCAAIHSQGHVVMVAGKDRPKTPGAFVEFLEMDTFQRRGKALECPDYVNTAAFSPDGRKLLTTDIVGGQLWDLQTRQIEKKFKKAELGCFYPDGRRLLIVSKGFGQVWDLTAEKWLGAPRFHPEGEIHSLAFSPDGRSVLVASADQTAQLWDVTTGKILGPTRGRVEVNTVAFSPTGNLLATGSLDGNILVWELPGQLGGSVARIRLWMEVQTGMELDAQEMIRDLTPAEVQERQRRLEELGGPPGIVG